MVVPDPEFKVGDEVTDVLKTLKGKVIWVHPYDTVAQAYFYDLDDLVLGPSFGVSEHLLISGKPKIKTGSRAILKVNGKEIAYAEGIVFQHDIPDLQKEICRFDIEPQRHKCNCDFNALLRDGCKCGGI